jgi:REP element-mobilizing transposase RayT
MARRQRLVAPGLLCHIIARGNHRQATFLTDLDYQAYLSRLAKYQQRYGVKLYAYCLMPNHVHLLLQTSEAPLAKFMQGLQQSYTQRFNRVHGKVGHLFQGRYKAIVCERDEYLVTLIRYIHLNPVRARLVDDPEAYPYSGHRAYLTGDGMALIDSSPVLNMLGGRAAYRRFVLAGIGVGHEDRYYQTEDQQFLGARPVAQRAGQQAAQPAGALPRKPLDIVVEELARRIPLDPSTLRSPDRSQPVSSARAALSFVLVRRLGYRVADVAAALGRDSATISVIVSRLASRLESSDRIAAVLTRLSRNV